MLENTSFPANSPVAVTWNTLKKYDGKSALKIISIPQGHNQEDALISVIFSREMLKSMFYNNDLTRETQIIKGVLSKVNLDLKKDLNSLVVIKESYFRTVHGKTPESGLQELKQYITFLKGFKEAASAAVRGTELFITKGYTKQLNLLENQAHRDELNTIIGNKQEDSGLNGLIARCDTEIQSAEEMLKFYTTNSSSLAKLTAAKASQEKIYKELLNSGTYKDLITAHKKIDAIIMHEESLPLNQQVPLEEERHKYKDLLMEIAHKLSALDEERFRPPVRIRLPDNGEGGRDHIEGEGKRDHIEGEGKREHIEGEGKHDGPPPAPPFTPPQDSPLTPFPDPNYPGAPDAPPVGPGVDIPAGWVPRAAPPPPPATPSVAAPMPPQPLPSAQHGQRPFDAQQLAGVRLRPRAEQTPLAALNLTNEEKLARRTQDEAEKVRKNVQGESDSEPQSDSDSDIE